MTSYRPPAGVHPVIEQVAAVEAELNRTLDARPRNSAACVPVLERAVALCRSDPAAAEVWVEAELLDELVDCYEAVGRVDDAITAMHRALQVGWAGQPDGRCRIAELLMRDGRVAEAAPIWAQVQGRHPGRRVAVQQRRPGIRRHRRPPGGVALAHRGPAPGHRHRGPRRARRAAARAARGGVDRAGRCPPTTCRTGPPSSWPIPRRRPAPDLGFCPSRPVPPGRCRRPPLPDRSASAATVAWPETFVVPPPGGPVPLFPDDPVTLALAWFPAEEYPQALARWPELITEGPAKGAKDHADYNRALQRTLQNYADTGQTRLFIAPIRIRPYLAWCARHDRDPAKARAGYCADLARLRDPSLIAWPPGRNERCWCGSGASTSSAAGRSGRHDRTRPVRYR